MEGSFARTTLAVIGLIIAAAIVAVLGLRHTSSIEADLSSVAANLVEAERQAAHVADQLQRVSSELSSEQRLRASAEQSSAEARRKASEAESKAKENLTVLEKLSRDLKTAVAERDSLRERLAKLEPPAAPVLPKVPAAPPRAVWFASLQELWRMNHPDARYEFDFVKKLGEPFATLTWSLRERQPNTTGFINWAGSWTEETWRDELYPRFKQPSRLWWPNSLLSLLVEVRKPGDFEHRLEGLKKPEFDRVKVILWELDANQTVVAMQLSNFDKPLPIVVLSTIPRDQFPVVATK